MRKLVASLLILAALVLAGLGVWYWKFRTVKPISVQPDPAREKAYTVGVTPGEWVDTGILAGEWEYVYASSPKPFTLAVGSKRVEAGYENNQFLSDILTVPSSVHVPDRKEAPTLYYARVDDHAKVYLLNQSDEDTDIRVWFSPVLPEIQRQIQGRSK